MYQIYSLISNKFYFRWFFQRSKVNMTLVYVGPILVRPHVTVVFIYYSVIFTKVCLSNSVFIYNNYLYNNMIIREFWIIRGTTSPCPTRCLQRFMTTTINLSMSILEATEFSTIFMEQCLKINRKLNKRSLRKQFFLHFFCKKMKEPENAILMA